MLSLATALEVGAPTLAFTTMFAVGLDLRAADFARLRRVPSVVAVGLFAPLMVLPAVALALVWWFRPDPSVEAGLLLVAVCPIGGISNTYSYLARASTALSVTLTGLSGVLAVVAIPVLSGLLERLLRQPLRVDAPIPVLGPQLVLILALPLALGMAIRHLWPQWAQARRPWFQRLAWLLLALLLLLILTIEGPRAASMLKEAVILAVLFVAGSFAAGWAIGTAVRASDADRFTLAAEFATRNIAIATAIAVTMLGRIEFAVFASVYFLAELPLMLAAVAAWRWRRRPAART